MGSLFAYGSEAWRLSDKCLRALNASLAVFKGLQENRGKKKQGRPPATNHFVTTFGEKRRLAWLGHILRMKDIAEGVPRLVKTTVKVQHELGGGGSILMDAPAHQSVEDLVPKAGNRRDWENHSESKFGKTGRRQSNKSKSKKKSKQRPKVEIGRWIGEGAGGCSVDGNNLCPN